MTERKRLAGLDGLRGLASLIVVFHHTNNAIVMPMSARRILIESPLAIVLNGQGAVQLFFVLSGYVLANSLSRSGDRPLLDLVQFYVRRILRIYPPYIIAVLFTFLVSYFYVVVPAAHGLTPWIRKTTMLHPSIGQVFSTFLFPGPALGLVPQGWTLRIEMIFSFLMPFMLLLARRTHWIVLVLLSCMGFLLDGALLDLWSAIDFALGIVLFLERERLSRWLTRVPQLLTPAIIGIGLYLFAAPQFLGWYEPNRVLGLLVGGGDPKSIAIMGVGSAVLVAVAVHVPWVEHILSTRPLAFLGRISFSLYLLHRTFIALFATNMGPQRTALDGFMLLGLVLLASLPASALCYRVVERPAIVLSGGICRWIAGGIKNGSTA